MSVPSFLQATPLVFSVIFCSKDKGMPGASEEIIVTLANRVIFLIKIVDVLFDYKKSIA